MSDFARLCQEARDTINRAGRMTVPEWEAWLDLRDDAEQAKPAGRFTRLWWREIGPESFDLPSIDGEFFKRQQTGSLALYSITGDPNRWTLVIAGVRIGPPFECSAAEAIRRATTLLRSMGWTIYGPDMDPDYLPPKEAA